MVPRMSLPLVLASTSAARRALLDQLGLAYEAIAPEVPEPLVQHLPAREQARAFALAKARAVAALRPQAVVVGADQVLELDGRSFGKPESEAQAFEQLQMLVGRTHALLTAIAIVAPGRAPVVDEEVSHLSVRPLTDAQLRAYVATGEWHGCAGSYRLEGRGLALFERIEGDHTNVLGLPIPRLLGHLIPLGIRPF